MTDPEKITDRDTALSMLLDDALPDAEARRWRERIAADPALALRLEELRDVDRALRGTYAGIVDEPLPERLSALLSPPAPVAAFHPRPARDTARSSRRVPPAMVAGLAMAAGFALAFLVLPRSATPGPLSFLETGGIVAQDTAVYDVLQRVPSGQSRALAGGWSATPRLTFKTAAGDPCRRLDLAGADAAVETVACRRDDAWKLELVGYASADPTSPGGTFSPAGGGPSSAVDDAIDAMIDGDALGREAEARWIELGWKHAAGETP